MEYSCNNSTNRYETMVGMLNIAPTKISGQYKLVYDKDLKPWLDDYTGRRVAVDTSISFLEQVAQFLSVSTFLSDNNCLRFGGFQRNTIKSWHIPFYFGSQLKKENYPKYFVLSRVPNETFDKNTIDNIYKFGVLVKVVDLESIGLYKILNEIQSESYFNYPLYFNHVEQTVQIFGFGIEEQYPIQYTLNLTKAYANQTYIDVINNKILNAFADNKMFFPRFLNVEFEFDYTIQTEQNFNNFYGYLSNSEVVDSIPTKQEQHNCYFINSRLDKFIYTKEDQLSDYTSDGLISNGYIPNLKEYQLEIGNCFVNETHESLPQVRFRLATINVGDIIRIKNGNNILFEYQVEYNDSQNFDTLYSMMVYLCKKMTNQANLDFEFSCKELKNANVIVTVISNVEESIYNITSKIELPYQAQEVDGDFEFRGVGRNDVILIGNLQSSVKHLVINDIKYRIIKIFNFNDNLICRLIIDNEKENYLYDSEYYDDLLPVQVTKLVPAFIYSTEKEKILKLQPINFLTYYTNLQAESINNFQEYVKSLKNEFQEYNNKDFINALTNFSGIPYETIGDANYNYPNKNTKQYIQTNSLSKKLEESDIIQIDYHNESIVKNILFNSSGCTGFVTPNILNIDRQFWIQNGCLSIDKQSLKYTWFLIAGLQPDYLKPNDLRYMDYDEKEKIWYPRITSRLVKITDSLCETIFLGVKYQLPIQYENWQFAVYLNFNDTEYLNKPEYYVEIYSDKKLILLSINKFLDFSDLIRGGNQSNEPILDLSFFDNIKTSYNECSEYFIDFSESNTIIGKKNLILEPFYNSDKNIIFNGEPVKDWIQDLKIDDNNYIRYFCLQGESLKNNFEIGKDKSVHVTAKITYKDREYPYESMRLTFKGIKEVNDTYLWFEDLEVVFFDIRDLFLQRYNQSDKINEVLKIQFENIQQINIQLPYQDSENADKDSPYYDYHKIVTIVEDSRQQRFELILPSNIDETTGKRIPRPISLKHDWFRISKNIEESNDGSIRETKFIEDPLIKEQQSPYKKYLTNIRNELLFDTATYNGEYNLFDRNQIWKIVQDMLAYDVKYKEYTEKQMYQELYKFSLDSFLSLPNKSIKIKNSNFNEFSDNYVVINAFDTDSNYVIWNIENNAKIIKINRHNGEYFPLLIIESNIEKFQINNYQVNNTLFNLYDKAFGGYIENTNIPISGTTLWEEIQGNIISTLFTKSDRIQLVAPYPSDNTKSINYYELLKKIIDYNKVIVTDDNHEYIDTLNKNVKPYIIETYAKMLLSKFYTLETVTDDEGLRIPFTIDRQNSYSIFVPNKLSLGIKYQNIKNIIFNLVRYGS